MASKSRSEDDRLELYRDLARDPYKYDFFQALRLIECANLEKEKIGVSRRLLDDPVRLNQEPSLAFAPSTIASFKLGGSDSQPRLSVFFFGLFGPNGPLPLHLTEYVRDRIRNVGDESFSRFADIFHHRLLSLFYRSWADDQPTVNLDRPEVDKFSSRVSSFIGAGYPSVKTNNSLDYEKLYFAGRFSNQTRNAEGLVAVLKTYFEMPVRLEQFIGSWLDIPDEAQMCLGDSLASGRLGLNSTLGAKVWECQSKFRLVFGSLDLENYGRMLPGGESLVRLIAILRNYVGDEIDWDVNLILKGEEVRPAQLGEFGQLGWTSWVSSEYEARDFNELYLNPM